MIKRIKAMFSKEEGIGEAQAVEDPSSPFRIRKEDRGGDCIYFAEAWGKEAGWLSFVECMLDFQYRREGFHRHSVEQYSASLTTYPIYEKLEELGLKRGSLETAKYVIDAVLTYLEEDRVAKEAEENKVVSYIKYP